MSTQPADVTLYTLSGCLHCARARRRLGRHGVEFGEVRGDEDPRFRQRLLELTGHDTVPQVVIDGAPVGGADDLARLDRRGVLGPRLERRPFPHPVIARRVLPGRWTVEVRDLDGRTVARPVAAARRRDADRVVAELLRPT
jgi:glutaredoxin 3